MSWAGGLKAGSSFNSCWLPGPSVGRKLEGYTTPAILGASQEDITLAVLRFS